MSILSLRFKFGQTYSKLLLGTTKGLSLFDIKNGELERVMENNIKNGKTNGSGVGLYDNLDDTNISLVVGGGEFPVSAPNRFSIVDSKNRDREIKKTIVMRDRILNAFIIRETDDEQQKTKNIVVTRNEIFLYSINGEIIASKPTGDNIKGLCSVVSSINPIVPLTIAYPGLNIGEVIIWRPHLDNQLSIKAHDSDITNISLSSDGKQVVTSSKNATNIHVYSTSNTSNNSGCLLHKFRRNTHITGVINIVPFLNKQQENSQILDTCISNNKEYVACCSSNGSIHLFDTKCTDDSENKKSSFEIFKQVSNYFDSKWAKHIISIGVKENMICGFDNDNNLHVVSTNGDYFFLSEKNDFKPKSHSLNIM